jgi:1-deoxy-D-xylulose-5-phosphate reductoisomerase
MKNLVILGSTGSIGRNALRVLKNLRERFYPLALSCYQDINLIASQAMEFNPEIVHVVDDSLLSPLNAQLSGRNITVLSGKDSLCRIAEMERVDILLNGIMGSSGFPPTLAAIKKGKRIALANKETLVSYGTIIMEEAKKNKAEIIPVDSEHSAIFQCLAGRDQSEIKRIILTSSGGPFRERDNLKGVTIEETLNHPVWNMGKKITVDSATMMNKAKEIIEAHYLFSLPPQKISVVIHPQCIIHSAVEYIDGSILAQLSKPDMALPIQYALTYPERKPSITESLDLTKIKTLTFEPVDVKKFPAISLAYRSIEMGGTAPAVLNAANESLVDAFLNSKISLEKITESITRILDTHTVIEDPSPEEVESVENWSRQEVEKLLNPK